LSLRSRVREALRANPITTSERVHFMLVNELHCDPALIHNAATFAVDLGFDDLDYETLCEAIDHEFDILFTAHDASVCPTVGHLIKWIDRQ
jgi:acyl carrier protein